jgi:transposase
MKEDQLVKWCNIQYETLSYIEERSRSVNRFVDDRDLSKALKIKRSTADGRLRRYTQKGWLKEQQVDGERKYVLRIEGLQRLQWLEHMQTRVSPKQFKKMLEADGVELPDWMTKM